MRARFGAYLLTDCIGQGGMAVVYRAKREGWSGFEKTVVVKAMLPSLAGQREHIDRFISEAKIQAQLSHPGIVQVHDFGVFSGTPYLVMEHLNGVNLAQLLNALATAKRRMPVAVALVIATQMCHALGYAHAFCDSAGARRQIIHCDVSPSNVMVCRDGSVKLLDFGVAKMIDASDYDISATVQGKFPYLAPEQVNRLPVDRRVDVFAAGIVVWEMLAGRRLFAAPTDLATLRRVDACEVPPPSLYNSEVTVGLDAVVLRALARDPAERFDSGDELASALMQVERVGEGRRRVAELLARLFPSTFARVCEVCGKQAVPGFACAECGNQLAPDAPSTENVRLEDVVSSEADLAPEILAITPAVAEPYPSRTVIDPRRATPLSRALAAVGSVGLAAGLAAWLARPLPTPTPRLLPSRDDSGPLRLVPRLPSSTTLPALPATTLPALPATTLATLPATTTLATPPATTLRPPPPATRAAGPSLRKLARVKPHPRIAVNAPPPPEKRVREGALLDPFGKDE